jgi:hypothetical protein
MGFLAMHGMLICSSGYAIVLVTTRSAVTLKSAPTRLTQFGKSVNHDFVKRDLPDALLFFFLHNLFVEFFCDGFSATQGRTTITTGKLRSHTRSTCFTQAWHFNFLQVGVLIVGFDYRYYRIYPEAVFRLFRKRSTVPCGRSFDFSYTVLLDRDSFENLVVTWPRAILSPMTWYVI